MLEEASEDTELGIDSGGGQTGGLRSREKISDALEGRRRDYVIGPHWGAPGGGGGGAVGVVTTALRVVSAY